MSPRHFTLGLLANAGFSLACIVVYALWFAPASAPRFAIVDVAELVRLKEAQVAATLVKRDGSETERSAALQRASAFGQELSQLVQSLPDACRCLILTRGAMVGPAALLTDLTPELRQRLGL